jgi:hypothetical protein
VLGPVLLAAVSAGGDRPAPMNELRGIVVFKEDGRPAVGVPVIMAHSEKGYLYFADRDVRGGGEDERVLDYFIKRNSNYFCTAITDEGGRFALTNFTAPDQRWNLAAGDVESECALRTGLRPQDYVERSLRLEIDKPAYVTTSLPPISQPLRAYLGVALAPETAGEPPDSSGGQGADATERIYFYGEWRGARRSQVRIGPLPGGQRYQVTAYASSRKLPYQATIFARTVTLAPGATETVSLESTEGLALAGRITSTDDKPLAQVNVMVKTAEGLVIGTLTDDDGKYELRGVPEGTHKLELLRHAVRKTPG